MSSGYIAACNSARRSSMNLLSRLTVDLLKPSFTKSVCLCPSRNTSRSTRSFRRLETFKKFMHRILCSHLRFTHVGPRIFDLHWVLFCRFWIAAYRPGALDCVHNSEVNLRSP